jgi:hypothetical protein
MEFVVACLFLHKVASVHYFVRGLDSMKLCFIC